MKYNVYIDLESLCFENIDATSPEEAENIALAKIPGKYNVIDIETLEAED